MVRFHSGSEVKNPANEGDEGLIPGSGRSPGEGNGNPWQENREELYKKGLNYLDNHNGVITHLELDIPEC